MVHRIQMFSDTCWQINTCRRKLIFQTTDWFFNLKRPVSHPEWWHTSMAVCTRVRNLSTTGRRTQRYIIHPTEMIPGRSILIQGARRGFPMVMEKWCRTRCSPQMLQLAHVLMEICHAGTTFITIPIQTWRKSLTNMQKWGKSLCLSLSLHFSKVLILNLPIGITLYKCTLSKLQLHRYGFLGFLKFFFHFKTIAKLEISLC